MIISFRLFERFQIEDHLRKRGIDPDKTRVIIDKELNDVYFFLYNLSGQMVGYQKYNPKYPKNSKDITDLKLQKYYNLISGERGNKMIAVWGLESLKQDSKVLFVVEGIFDAARIHQTGYPAIAVLGNDPNPSLVSWLYTLPQKKIVIYDNDENNAGLKLRKVGDESYCVPKGKDMNDLNVEEATKFIQQCLKVNENQTFSDFDLDDVVSIATDEGIKVEDVKGGTYGGGRFIAKDFLRIDYHPQTWSESNPSVSIRIPDEIMDKDEFLDIMEDVVERVKAYYPGSESIIHSLLVIENMWGEYVFHEYTHATIDDMRNYKMNAYDVEHDETTIMLYGIRISLKNPHTYTWNA